MYGNPGDIETYVGNRQIAERAERLYTASGQQRPLAKCTPADLAALADAGDHIAIALWDAIGTDIGAALSDGVWLLNPDTIVIGGGIAAAGDTIIAPIRRTICERTSALFTSSSRSSRRRWATMRGSSEPRRSRSKRGERPFLNRR